MTIPGTKYHELTFASGASETNSVFVGNTTRVSLYVINPDSFNAGTGNIVYRGFGSYASGITQVPVPVASLTTQHSGIFDLSGLAGVPRISIKFNTAVTGGAANKVVILTSQD